jgi:hypothetical protein
MWLDTFEWVSHVCSYYVHSSPHTFWYFRAQDQIWAPTVICFWYSRSYLFISFEYLCISLVWGTCPFRNLWDQHDSRIFHENTLNSCISQAVHSSGAALGTTWRSCKATKWRGKLHVCCAGMGRQRQLNATDKTTKKNLARNATHKQNGDGIEPMWKHMNK